MSITKANEDVIDMTDNYAFTGTVTGVGGLAFISSTDISSAATFAFTAVDAAAYDSYIFHLMSVTPATDAVHLWMRTSTDGGSNYDSGSNEYSWSMVHIGNGADTDDNLMTDTKMAITGDTADPDFNIGSSANEEGVSGTIQVFGPHMAKRTKFTWLVGHNDSGGSGFQISNGGGERESAADVDGIQILFSSGNIESGTISVYGVKNA